MEKFLKITLSDAPFLIPIREILYVEVGADTHIQVLFRGTALGVTSNASSVLGLQITATTASDATKTKQQLTAFANLVAEALTTSWTNPVLDITSRLPYVVTAITQIEEEWSA
jgi:hypothetical protein